VPGLIALLNTRDTPAKLQEEICIILGSIGNFQAVPALIARLRKKAFFLARQKPDIERVRLRAAWSLRKFSGPDVEQALHEASSEKIASIALTAKESLGILRARKDLLKDKQ
jgi:hypothetical protein